MTIIVDSREQKWKHVQTGFDRLGIRWIRSKLYVGDYGRIDNMSTVIDRKADLQEVAGNLIQEHDRFRRECLRARDAGIRLIVLIEEAGLESAEDVKAWVNPRRGAWERISRAHRAGRMLETKIPGKPPVNGVTLSAIMTSMAERYGVEWQFCPREHTAGRIADILAQIGGEHG